MQYLNTNTTGIVPIYKPIGPTSHDMIYRIRRLTGVKRVGHAGTLDPLAEGVLVVGITREATKKLSTHVKKEKVYESVFTLGISTTTDDRGGEPIPRRVSKIIIPSIGQIQHIISNQFIGEIWQTPPNYSAIKISGMKAYQLTRKGQPFSLEPRLRQVLQFTILAYEYPMLKVKITTGAGVYIRSLARDLGNRLGVGGHMSQLIRTKVGDFSLEDCYHVPDGNKHISKDSLVMVQKK